MTRSIKLLGSGGNRSARCVWTVQELGVEVTQVDTADVFNEPARHSVHPQGKIPAAIIDDEYFFESSAICLHLCDLYPKQALSAAPGSTARAEITKWISFAQSEIEAYLWHSFLIRRAGGDLDSQAIHEFNNHIAKAGLGVLADHLTNNDYLCGTAFSVADIVVGWTVNWSSKQSLLANDSSLVGYLDRLHARQCCALVR